MRKPRPLLRLKPSAATYQIIRSLAPALLLLSAFAQAADYSIGSGTSTVDGDTFCSGTCQPGDTLTFSGTARGTITFRDLHGSSGNPITIRNDVTESGPLVITDSGTGGFSMNLDDTSFLTIDGTGLWSGVTAGHGCGATYSDTTGDESSQACGIVLECSSGSITGHIKITDEHTDLTIKGVEIDGNFPTCGPTGIGFQLHDNAATQTIHGAVWYENWLIEDTYMHDIPHECMYVGSNIAPDRLIPLRNNVYQNNLAVRCGWDALSFKLHNSQMSYVRGNIVISTGINPVGESFNGNSGAGIDWFESAFLTISENWVADTGGNGPGSCYAGFIQKATPSDFPEGSDVVLFNNVAVDCQSEGINVGKQNDPDETEIELIAYNNTIVGAAGRGIDVDNDFTTAATIQDNIVCDSGGADIDGGSGADVINNNITGACSSVGFVNLAGRDFHLATGSSAISAAGNYVSPPDDDFDGVARPQGAAEDAGAFEFIESGGGGGGGDDITTPKPSPFTIDSGETHYPNYLWLFDEGSGATVEDYGSSTDCDLTVTGADWSTDALGKYLSFVEANSDFAEGACTGTQLQATLTMCVIVRIDGPQGNGKRWAGFFDNSAEAQVVMQTTGSLGYLQSLAWDATTSNTNEAPPEITDNLWNMACTRVSDTQNDISVNGSGFDTETQALTNVLDSLDLVAFGRDSSIFEASYANADIIAAWAYLGSKSDAEIATIYNSGDPWPIIGVDPSSGPPPVAQRGQFNSAEVSQ